MNPVVRNCVIVVAAIGGVTSSPLFFNLFTGAGGASSGYVGFDGGGAVTFNQGTCQPTKNQLTNANIGFNVNSYRSSVGLAPLANAGPLGASFWVGDMTANGFVGIINTQAQNILQYLQAQEIPFKNAAILVFGGCPANLDANNVIQQWLADPACAAVLNYPNWTDIDFASGSVITDPNTSDGYFLFAVVFRELPSSNPPF
jgi:hypothetical protein